MRPDDAKKELAAAVAGLKWVLSGLGMAGIHFFNPTATVGVVLEAMHGGEVAARPVAPAFSSERNPYAAEGLEKIAGELEGCDRCRLHTDRRTVVVGEGSDRSGLVFVGEGPGFEEDQQGRPFVGKAGKLLDKMIRAIGLGRGDVYICNVVKCRPPQNRTPLADEMEACLPFLFRQIEALKPRLVCALGACAAQALLGRSTPISKIRGKVLSWRGTPLICTFHPAYLLRNSAQKGAAWQDLREAHRVLNQKTG